MTLPALHQEAITSREKVFDNARKAKAKAYPRKDASGRLLTESACIPFILSSMGGLCKEGHQFLKICKKKDPVATLRMIDVLVTQHSKWTARRVRRSLFGQSIVDFTADPWESIKDGIDSKAAKATKKTKSKQSRLEKEFSQAESQPSQATPCVESAPANDSRSAREEIPDGTVYFSSNSSSFQDFSGFQLQSFQDPHFQYSSQDPHFHNAQHHFQVQSMYPQEQCFQAFSGNPDV